MNGIKDYFDRIELTSSPEEMAKRLMAARKNPTAKKRSFKPLAAVAAAVMVLAVGVTGAAAAGLLDLNTIFDGFVKSEDEKLAEELLSCAQNIEWYTSDEDYEIVVKGVTGSAYDMMVSYEIVRTDGKPVKDFFTNIPEDGVLSTIHNIDEIFERHENGDDSVRDGEYRIMLNEEGNIEIFERYMTDVDITGYHNVTAGYNFYPKKQFARWQWENELYPHYDENGAYMLGSVVNEEHVSEIFRSEMSAEDESIIGLALDWRLEFDYYPTEAAMKSKTITEINDTMWLRQYYLSALWLREYTLIEGVFTSVSGQLTISRPHTNGEAFSIANEYSECFLTTSDGEHIDVSLHDMGEYHHENWAETDIYRIDVRYSAEDSSEITMVDVDTITAISINGTVFPVG